MQKNLLRFGFSLALLVIVSACGEQRAQSNHDAKADLVAIHALLDRIVEVFDQGDIEGAMKLFTSDAIIFPESGADIVGSEAIRAVYSGMLSQFIVVVSFDSKEVELAGDLAYERGLYRLKLTDRTSGQVASDTEYRYVHIYQRQTDGGWKTWRLMVNSLQASAETGNQ